MPTSPTTSSDSPTPDMDDPMLEVMLDEVLGQKLPPDLTQTILQSYRASRASDDLPGVAKARLQEPKETADTTKSPALGIALALVATVLIAVGIAVGIRSQFKVVNVAQSPTPDAPPSVQSAKTNPANQNDIGAPAPPTAETIAEGLTPRQQAPFTERPGKRITSRTLELAGPPTADSSDKMSPLDALADRGAPPQADAKSGEVDLNDTAQAPSPDSQQPRPLVSLKPFVTLKKASRSVQQHLVRYWDRIDVEPTEIIPAPETVERLHQRLNLNLSARAINNPWLLKKELMSESNLRSLATGLLEQLPITPSSDSNQFAVEAMRRDLRESLQQGSGADKLIVAWLTGSDEVASPPRKTALHALTPHQAIVAVSSLTSNLDRRCQRCHDVPPTGQPVSRQSDYWQFYADALPLVDAARPSGKPIFFDTIEGIRKSVTASKDLSTFKSQWIGSKGLAGGLVDWVWRTVHGRSLVSSQYDLRGGSDSHLKSLHDELADDLIASDFDLLRTIAIVMDESIVGRQTPAAMRQEGIMMVGETEWTQALAAIDSFAAAPPTIKKSSPKQRLSMVAQEVRKRNGTASGMNSGGSNSILAQPISADESSTAQRGKNGPAPKPVLSEAALAGMPIRSTIVMPAWISELPSFESRRDHIAHLASQLQLPSPIALLANQMQKSGVDEALILQRIWWIVQN